MTKRKCVGSPMFLKFLAVFTFSHWLNSILFEYHVTIAARAKVLQTWIVLQVQSRRRLLTGYTYDIESHFEMIQSGSSSTCDTCTSLITSKVVSDFSHLSHMENAFFYQFFFSNFFFAKQTNIPKLILPLRTLVAIGKANKNSCA